MMSYELNVCFNFNQFAGSAKLVLFAASNNSFAARSASGIPFRTILGLTELIWIQSDQSEKSDTLTMRNLFYQRQSLNHLDAPTRFDRRG